MRMLIPHASLFVRAVNLQIKAALMTRNMQTQDECLEDQNYKNRIGNNKMDRSAARAAIRCPLRCKIFPNHSIF